MYSFRQHIARSYFHTGSSSRNLGLGLRWCVMDEGERPVIHSRFEENSKQFRGVLIPYCVTSHEANYRAENTLDRLRTSDMDFPD